MKKRFLTVLLASLVACVAVSLFGCGKTVEFKVDFMVDGSVYASVSTSGDEVIKMPNDPEKSGYVFDGWYWDEGTWQKPFTANSLLNEPLSSNMSVYAKWKGDKLTFKTLTLNDDNTVYGKVSNSQTTFSFLNEIEIVGKATFVVSTDIYGINQIPTKTVPLEIGDNTFYVTETIGNNIKLYTVTVRRRPFYTVTFNTNNGTFVGNQIIEEDSFATEPTTTRVGYTFTGWNYDFTQAITKNTTITAVWSANTDTKYKVEYYQQNLENDDYTLYEAFELKGTTNARVYAERKSYEHFTLDEDNSIWNGNITGNGSLVLKLYYTRNLYTLSNENTEYGEITNARSKKYGSPAIETVATEYLGCEFLGWYNGEELLSTDKNYTFNIDKDITAKFKTKDELSDFIIAATKTTCEITGIKDKTVTQIIIPDCITSIREGSFKSCSSLESITILFIGASREANNGYDQVFGYIFGYTTSSSSDSISGATYQYGKNSTYYHYYIPSGLRTVIIGNEVAEIPRNSFYNCSGLTSITIPGSVTSIGGYAFYNCSRLTSITIPDGVTSIGFYAFYCSRLTSITIPDGVTSIGYSAFYNCTRLTSITIPDSVTSIGDSAFYNTAWYNNQPKGLVYAGKVAYTYKGTMPDNTAIVIKEGTLGIGGSAFNGRTGLKSITIPDSVTNIGDYAFNGCTRLTSITIPDSVTNIGNDAFRGTAWYNNQPEGLVYAGKLAYKYKGKMTDNTAITVKEGIIGLVDCSFQYCDGLASIILPDSVTSIGHYAFESCEKLINITYNGTTEQWKAIKKGKAWKRWVPSDCIIHCTDGDLNI